jgi:hypothetical protein
MSVSLLGGSGASSSLSDEDSLSVVGGVRGLGRLFFLGGGEFGWRARVSRRVGGRSGGRDGRRRLARLWMRK